MQEQSRFTNPFYDYTTVRDPAMFFGRNEQLRDLYEACEKQQCISIVGSRHIGKSSILRYLSSPEIQRRFDYHPGKNLFILIDLHDYLSKTRDDFFRLVCEIIVEQGRQVIALTLSPVDGEDQFRRVLEDLHKAGFHPILLMDAFDKITENPQFDPNFFSFLRSQATRGLVSYITASIKPLYEVCHPRIKSSPFFDIFRNCQLGALTASEAQELMLLPTMRVGSPFSTQDMAWIEEQAGRHPFFLQVTCRYLFEKKVKRLEEEIDYEHVFENVYSQLLPLFEFIWQDLTDEQQEELLHGAGLQLKSLRKTAELSESRLFYRWVRENFPGDLSGITTKDLKDALDNLDNFSFLQGCKLNETHYVSMLRAGKNLSVNAQGKLVADFLRTAFESMRASGVRSDTAPEWKFYNILYYHYFKHHLQNEQTAARMAISRRQFYREQDRAIQLLLQELLELEIASLK